MISSLNTSGGSSLGSNYNRGFVRLMKAEIRNTKMTVFTRLIDIILLTISYSNQFTCFEHRSIKSPIELPGQQMSILCNLQFSRKLILVE